MCVFRGQYHRPIRSVKHHRREQIHEIVLPSKLTWTVFSSEDESRELYEQLSVIHCNKLPECS